MKGIMEGISPLPWSQKGTDERGVSTQRLIKNGEDDTIAVVCDKTHADYIVKSTKLYPELVAALEFYADKHGDGYDVMVTDYGLSLERGFIIRDGGELARSTLTKYKAKP